MSGRRRSFIPALPLPRRLLLWLLFAGGAAVLAYGAMTGDVAGLTIGAVAVGGATLSWAAEWLLRAPDHGDE
jgi:hypothetical protein